MLRVVQRHRVSLRTLSGKALFDPIGIVFICVGSLADAMAASYEEKRFFVQILGMPVPYKQTFFSSETFADRGFCRGSPKVPNSDGLND